MLSNRSPCLLACHTTPRLVFALALGLAVGGCSLPEYRLLVSNIPSGATKLEAAAYLLDNPPTSGRLPSDHFDVKIPGDRSELSVTVNLQGQYDKPDLTVFSGIVRDSASCILATGNSPPQPPSSTVADLPLMLMPIPYPKAAMDRCKTSGPVVVDIQRQEQGSFGKTDFRLLVSGWDFMPSDTVTVKSKHPIPSTMCQFTSCKTRCPDTVDCLDPATGAPATCQSGCSVEFTLEYASPGLFIVRVPETGNTITDAAPPPRFTYSKLSTNLTAMRGSPFAITVSRAAGTPSSSFVEVDPAAK